jgi:hypothetical protein
MAGFKSDQKLAAIMTPAAKPSIALSTFLLIDLKKKTMAEPNAVTNHVNIVARKANNIGSYSINQSKFLSIY